MSEKKNKEREERHARKEQNLRLSFRGNSNARIESVRNIIHGITVDKHPHSEYVQEVERLLAYPENYINCEREYNALFMIFEENELMKKRISSFKSELTKTNLPQASRRFLKD